MEIDLVNRELLELRLRKCIKMSLHFMAFLNFVFDSYKYIRS